MHHAAFLQDLAIVMLVASVATLLFRWMKQPVVLGYILAGIVIGPHTPPVQWISDRTTVDTLAELGVVFLMFSLGLEFSLRKLKRVGATAFVAASLEILLMVFVGYELGQAFGWSPMDSLFLGAILSISSTTIIVKALAELGRMKERFTELTFGILIVEDILAIVMIALLSGFAVSGKVDAFQIGEIVLRLGSFLGLLLVSGLLLVPRLLNHVASFKNDEILLVTVVGLCFGVSLLTVKLGYSVALGAFLIGAIIAEARQITKIETLMHPVRDLFSAVFFVSIGLLIDPRLLLTQALPILAITAVVILGKVFACALGCFAAGHDTRTSLRVGMSLAQIGEFSFIIASLGLSLGVTSSFLYPIAVAVSALTTLATPYLVRHSDTVVRWFDRIAPTALVQTLESYTLWLGRLGGRKTVPTGRRILSRIGLQMGLNVLLLTGIFIAAVFLEQRAEAAWPGFPGGENALKALAWLASVLVSFPLLVATWRKLEAGALIVASMRVSTKSAGADTRLFRSLISGGITIVGTLTLLLFLFLLSSALLPTGNMLLLVVLVLLVAGMRLYRWAVKFYASAQFALRDTFAGSGPADSHPGEPEADPLPSLLRQARLLTLEVAPGSPAENRIIAELRIRTETGASVVGIDRGGVPVINPAPHEEFKRGDQVLLIGTAEQLAVSRALFAAPDRPGPPTAV
jgi:CPA2 family monovalent cation:H+ antiporter-2